MPTAIPNAKLIVYYRTQVKRISQKELARLSGVSLRVIEGIEGKEPMRERKVSNLRAIQGALGIPPDLAFLNGLPEMQVLLPFERTNLAQVSEVGRLAQRYLADATELRGYGEFLPCSLETDDFMCQHHESIFSQRYENHEPWMEIVNGYNTVGRNQRSGFDSGRLPFLFTHMMVESHLDEIADPRASQYSRVSTETRIACLERVCDLVSTRPTTKLRMLIIPKDKESRLRQEFSMRTLFSVDSMVVVYDRANAPTFTFFRRPMGDVGYTDRTEDVRRNAQVLDALLESATISGSALVARIKSMLERLRRSS